MFARELKSIILFSGILTEIFRPKKMRLKRKVKTNTHSSDPDLPRDMGNETEAIISTRGKRGATNLELIEINCFKFGSSGKKLKEVASETSQKIMRKMPENEVSSQSNPVSMKELQIKLKRCNALPVGVEQIIEAVDGAEQQNERSNTNGSSKKKSRNIVKKMNSVPEAAGFVHADDEFPDVHINKNVQIHSEKLEGVQQNIEAMKSCEDLELPIDVTEVVKHVPNQTGKGNNRKRGRRKQSEEKSDDDVKPAKSAKKEKDSDKSKSSREKIPDVTAIDFSNDSKSSSGNVWNFKVSSWNVNGIRAWLEKNGLSYLHHEKPDVICIQETKCSDDKLPREMKKIEGYHSYWLSGDKDGYSGVGLLSKEEPIKVDYGIGIPEHDNEGRVITAEYEKFYLVAAYVPNAGRKLVRLEYRMKWDEDFRVYLKKLDAQKPVILCGDLNVAHEEIDLANPKTNKKNAGFTKEEREGFSTLLKEGFTDTFRHLYPDVTAAYTFWTYMMNARAKNVGWRLDYFVISERFCENLCDSVIRKDVLGSDHCPVTLFLSL